MIFLIKYWYKKNYNTKIFTLTHNKIDDKL